MDDLPVGFSYFREGNSVKIKEITQREEAEKWIAVLSKVSMVTWKVARTYPHCETRGKRLCFKRQYRCQHNTRKTTTIVKKTKNCNCPATLCVKIKRPLVEPEVNDERTAKRKPKKPPHKNDADSEWPCVVDFYKDHNHPIGTPSALRYRPISSETEKAICDLFERGHTPATAFITYCEDKKIELGASYYSAAPDRSVFPTKEDFKNIWKKDFRHKYVSRNEEDMLKRKLEQLILQGHHACLSSVADRYVVSMCTPLMQRAFSLGAAKEVLVIDATGRREAETFRFYFLSTYCSSAGYVPLGCILCGSGKPELFSEGLRSFIQEFNVFTTSPLVIMSDDDWGERNAITHFFPGSKLMMATFHVLKACWRWLMDKSNNIAKEDRLSLYLSFKNMVYATNMGDFQKFYTQMQYMSCPQFVTYVNTMIVRKETWAHCFRQGLLSRENDINPTGEVIFRFFRDIPLERCKAFNLVQLVDFVAITFEKFYAQRLLDAAHSRVTIETLRRMCPTSKAFEEQDICVLSPDVYSVKFDNTVFELDLSSGVCTCTVGTNIKPKFHACRICKHQIAVVRKFNIVDPSIHLMEEKNQHDLFWVATAKVAPRDYFYNLQNRIDHQLQQPTDQMCHNNILQEYPSPDGDSMAHSDVSLEDANVLCDLDQNSVLMDLDRICQRIKEEIIKDPNSLVPAVKKLISNFDTNCQTTTEMVSGLSSAFSTTTRVKPLPVAPPVVNGTNNNDKNPPLVLVLQKTARKRKKPAKGNADPTANTAKT